MVLTAIDIPWIVAIFLADRIFCSISRKIWIATGQPVSTRVSTDRHNQNFSKHNTMSHGRIIIPNFDYDKEEEHEPIAGPDDTGYDPWLTCTCGAVHLRDAHTVPVFFRDRPAIIDTSDEEETSDEEVKVMDVVDLTADTVDLSDECYICREEGEIIYAACTTANCGKTYCAECYMEMSRLAANQGKPPATCAYCLLPAVVVDLV